MCARILWGVLKLGKYYVWRNSSCFNVVSGDHSHPRHLQFLEVKPFELRARAAQTDFIEKRSAQLGQKSEKTLYTRTSTKH